MDTNMDMNKVIYFVAAGVLALGLQSEYKQGSFPALHRVAEQADCLMSRVAVDAERTLVMAIGRTPASSTFRSSSLQRSLAAETLATSTTAAEMSRMQAEMMREKARSQAECVRETVREQVRAQAEVRRAVYQIQQELQRSQMRSRVRIVSTSD
jgi:hypothetical protein